MGKLSATKCGRPQVKGHADHDSPIDHQHGDHARDHLWGSAPTIEQTEHGPVAWWLCGRCPARVLHDPETEDGMPAEPVVVYPPRCFEIDVCACGGPLGYHEKGARHCVESCGCPRRASGDVVHLEGCADVNARVEAHLRELDEEAGFTGPLSLAPTEERPLLKRLMHEAFEDGRLALCGAPEPAVIVHPPTDPAPPSEELARAIEDLEEEEIPTQRYPVVETGPSVFERIERLFGRTIIGEAR